MSENSSFDENVGMLMTEWYDEKANDWRSRVHFDYDDRLMRELSMSDLIAVECYSGEGEEKHYGILSIVRKQAWDQALHSMLKNLDEHNPKDVEDILKKKRIKKLQHSEKAFFIRYDKFLINTAVVCDDSKKIIITAMKTKGPIKWN